MRVLYKSVNNPQYINNEVIMPISYRVIERIEPGVPGGGRRRYYAKEKNSGRLAVPEIIRRIEKTSTYSGADIRGMIYALFDVVGEGIAEGELVELGELGTFRISLKSRGHDLPSEVSGASITGARIIYAPGPALKEKLRSLRFKKA